MTLLYHDPRFLEHLTGRHVEQPLRLTKIGEELSRRGLIDRCRKPDWPPSSGEKTQERLARFHRPSYIDQVRRFAESGGGHLDADTVVSRRSFEVACLAANAACSAVEQVATTTERRALCLVRPPGHHALAENAMGFCLFGNAAIAAHAALAEFSLDRVLIVDWDVHHGNGTQAAFYEDGRVGFLSVHRWPFWPGTGDVDETGAGRGLGSIVNLPTRFGTARGEYLKRFSNAVEKLADKIKPQLVIVSAGFDAHARDPIGSLDLETEDFVELTRIVLNVADVHAGGRVVSVLEGGYDPDDLAANVAAHLETLLEHDA
jgi:acetoin utilization deacetylase AcuC-like enzyme